MKTSISSSIIEGFKDTTRADIMKWRNALKIAQHPTDPRSHYLQDLYDNLESDGHFVAQKELRKGATLGYDFSIVDRKSGELNQEKTDLFREEWFYNFLSMALDSIFRGYTIIELTDTKVLHFERIPYRNVVGKSSRIYPDVMGNKFIDYSKGFESTLIQIGQPDSLGIMADICGQLIWKRNAQQSWAEFTERFGMPLISATTSKTSKADIEQIDQMLASLGEAARAVLPEGTTISIQPFTGGDSFQVFDTQIERINAEISKPIVGGTMVSDDGSSRSQSEVHERNLDDKLSEADRRMISFVVNGQLIPMLAKWGFPVNPDSDKFQFNQSFELDLAQHWNIVNQMISQGYEVDEKWLSQTFNVPITGRTRVESGENREERQSLYRNFR